MKLISMTEKVLQLSKDLGIGGDTFHDFYLKSTYYANFLSQPLTLSMFLPCVDNVPLEEPIKYKNWCNYNYSGTDIGFKDEAECRAYDKAKENVLFEGFELKGNNLYHNNFLFGDYNFLKDYNIEYLVKYNLTLTEKQQLK